MLEDLCENNSYEVLKRTAEDRSAWRESMRKEVPKPAVQQTKTEEEDKCAILYVHVKVGTCEASRFGQFRFESDGLIQNFRISCTCSRTTNCAHCSTKKNFNCFAVVT